ncbi:hypothetical protein ACIBAI_27465 [Streptomyces sp. NPDC051041]|uniref:hypothetical protein n=1 Tax=Streptomyces sp. NPDC051041 TaxID=3365640 RepID=UPI0037BC0865
MSTPAPVRVALVNGSFEQPQVTDCEILPDASQPQAPKSVPGWRTTASGHKIELWCSGFLQVKAAEGEQFAGLNANQESTLYQDLPTDPGTKLYWRLYHRGRLGQDTMALGIGAPGRLVEQRRFTDGDTAWGYNTGACTVPAGQTVIRFAFRSVSAAGGNHAIGSFLDGVVFATAPFVTLTKHTVLAGPPEVGDVVTYRIVVRNEGGGDAEALSLSDVVPSGAMYVPGSLRIVSGPNAGAQSDQPDDDQAYFDPVGDRVVFHLGNGATSGRGGALPNTDALPEGTTVEYRVRIDEASAGGHLANTATAAYENRLGPVPEPLTATSNEAVTRVNPAAGLSVTKSADTTRPVVQRFQHRPRFRHRPDAAWGGRVRPRPGRTRQDRLPAPALVQRRLPDLRRDSKRARTGDATVDGRHGVLRTDPRGTRWPSTTPPTSTGSTPWTAPRPCGSRRSASRTWSRLSTSDRPRRQTSSATPRSAPSRSTTDGATGPAKESHRKEPLLRPAGV